MRTSDADAGDALLSCIFIDGRFYDAVPTPHCLPYHF